MAVFTLSRLILSLGLAVVFFTFWKLVKVLIWRYNSSLRYLPGPPSSHWLWGNMKAIFDAEHSVLHEEWVERYGPTIKYHGFFNLDRLFTMDMRALNHVLSHSMNYEKPEHTRFNLSQVLGSGLLVVEGEQHRQQRRIMNPAFGPAQVRELTEIFLEKARELRDVWSDKIAASSGSARINVIEGLSQMTLDSIGLAGFNYEFHALNPHGKPNELYEAFNFVFSNLASNRYPVFQLLRSWVPIFRRIPTEMSKRTDAAQAKMKEIGMQLLAQKKEALLKAAQAGKEDERLGGRDLLTLLLKANMAIDIPESQRLTDADVLAQVPTFLVAGHETTSTATMWCLFALSQVPEVQEKLRDELLSVPTENPSMDELQELPYLEAVVRETMRIHAPVPSTIRIATEEDIIPLNTPFVDTRGEIHDSIRIAKGSNIFIPILAVNRSKALWGDDAHEFRPDRWIEGVPEAVASIPGVWGNLMSFLGGPHACIGYRFSLIEMKCLVFTLVRAFEYELAVPVEEIMRKSGIVTRPLLRNEKEKGSQMPLLVKPYRAT
ncbi:cytochrome P450 [Sparassis crispa]|uniref:Cytochrome P450 n=1 Tax=Sparassis crispa TaxID=139825 RepID=A0A401H1V9_9APHY|nr:cytochrome P450 [Sparassis crispa]GBE88427.1 cytochrome P450 [Sparassis crispa]